MDNDRVELPSIATSSWSHGNAIGCQKLSGIFWQRILLARQFNGEKCPINDWTTFVSPFCHWHKIGQAKMMMMMSHCKKVTWDYARSDHRLNGGLHRSRKVIFEKYVFWKSVKNAVLVLRLTTVDRIVVECPKTWKKLKPAPPWTFGFF